MAKVKKLGIKNEQGIITSYDIGANASNVDYNGSETVKDKLDNSEKKSISLTLAEYNALPESKKLDGTTYYITDAEAAPSIISDLMFSLNGTLEAGETIITFTDNRISSTSKVLMLNKIGDEIIPPISESTEGHSITLTYDLQTKDVIVCIVVFNV